VNHLNVRMHPGSALVKSAKGLSQANMNERNKDILPGPGQFSSSEESTQSILPLQTKEFVMHTPLLTH